KKQQQQQRQHSRGKKGDGTMDMVKESVEQVRAVVDLLLAFPAQYLAYEDKLCASAVVVVVDFLSLRLRKSLCKPKQNDDDDRMKSSQRLADALALLDCSCRHL